MTTLAYVLVSDADATFADALVQRLQRAAYAARAADGHSDLGEALAREQPDILILGPNLADPLDAVRTAKALPGMAQLPVLLLTNEPSGATRHSALAAGVDDVLVVPDDAEILFHRLRPLARLGTLQTELARRTATAVGFGLTPVAAPVLPDRRPAVLVAGADADADAVTKVLQADADVVTAASPVEAEALLSRQNLDAAVLVANNDAEQYLDLCAHLRNNPRLSNLPMVVLAAPDSAGSLDAHQRGASSLFPTAFDPQALHATVQSLVRRQQRRYALRDALAATLTAATSDELAGTYNRDFLLASLADRLAELARRDRHLSVLYFHIANLDAVRDYFGEEAAAHLAHQLGQWIAGLLRVEDLTARARPNGFAVILPDTPPEEADRVLHRIAGVLTYTDFAVKDVYQPVKVWVLPGMAQPQAGEDAESLLRRAQANCH